jgi:hypothetical protein
MVFVLKELRAKHGTSGLYKGLPVTLARAAPANALILMSFELVNDLIKGM